MANKKGKEHASDISEECIVCTNAFNTSSRIKVECPFCVENTAHVCRECTQTYLLGSVQDPHCMQCKHDWDLTFFINTFPKSFVNGSYRKSRQAKMLEREMGMMAEAIPYAEERRIETKENEEILELKRKIRSLKLELHEKEAARTQRLRARDGNKNIKRQKDEPKKVQYMMKCTSGDCRGMIEANSWKCGLCNIPVCKKCHVVLPIITEQTQENKHECKKEDLDTAKMIMKETKACPKCSVRIFKIDGCDQMYCTSCYTPFSWKTGEIVTGTIHNPHYYELKRKLGVEIPRAPGDVRCGGVPDIDVFRNIFNYIGVGDSDDDEFIRMKDIHRLVAEISDILTEGNERRHRARTARVSEALLVTHNTLEIRILYLIGELDDAGLTRRLFALQRRNERTREVRNVLETFRDTILDRMRLFIDAANKLMAGKPNIPSVCVKVRNATEEFFKECDTIIQFCNDAFKKNLELMGFKSLPVLRFGKRFEPRGLKDTKDISKTKPAAKRATKSLVKSVLKVAPERTITTAMREDSSTSVDFEEEIITEESEITE